jgi:hypothetical protein
VRITPSFITASADLKNQLNREERECRYFDENEDMQIFANYTQVGRGSIFSDFFPQIFGKSEFEDGFALPGSLAR